jgi:hypothetical protein
MWIKAIAIVAHLHHEPFAFYPNVDFDARAVGVAVDVVDALLENQIHLSPQLVSIAIPGSRLESRNPGLPPAN